MYNPAPRTDGLNAEFIEIYNTNPSEEIIGGFRLSGEVDFTFPANTRIPGYGYLVIAGSATDFPIVYPAVNAVGAYQHKLSNGSGTVRLRNKTDAIVLEVTYSDSPPWPGAADGGGHSLVLASPSYGENNPKAWAASASVGGSPGGPDPAVAPSALDNIVINEIFASGDTSAADFIELYNHSTNAVDISGCSLTNNYATNWYQVPAATTLNPRSFITFTSAQLGFSLPADGGVIYFMNPARTRVIDAVHFDNQARNVSLGRFPDGAPGLQALAQPTSGTTNSPLFQSSVVINEIMYNPISGLDDDEYVELYNRTTNAINLEGWQLSGGISFTFPASATVGAHGYVVAAKNSARLLTNYGGVLNANNTFGNYGGKLGNSGDRVTLTKPSEAVGFCDLQVVVNEVVYGTGGRWGNWSDGGGSSLELRDARSDNRLAYNWADSFEESKSAWTTVQSSNILSSNADSGDGTTSSRLELILSGAGECLIDNVEVLTSGNSNYLSSGNSTFNSGLGGWVVQGNHEMSTNQASGGVTNSPCLRLRASGEGDYLANRAYVSLASSFSIGQPITVRAQVRWLKGEPELVFRLTGNRFEAVGRMLVPQNLGTPGAVNSQATSNAPPAIFDVVHAPALPTNNQPIVITARVSDPDGIAAVFVQYRIDPSLTYTTTNLLDNGTGGDAVAGDGLFSATLPGRTSGTLLAFRVFAVDNQAMTNRFPNYGPGFPGDIITPECLVRFGEPLPATSLGAYGTYHLWVTKTNRDEWTNRRGTMGSGPGLHNGLLDATLVYDDQRVIYNVCAGYGGSAHSVQSYTSGPDVNLCGYKIDGPADDVFLGSPSLTLDANGAPAFSQHEQIGYWISKEIGNAYNNRRYVKMHFNGTMRPGVYEDIQQPGGDVIKEFFPDDNNGDLYKFELWSHGQNPSSGAVDTPNRPSPLLSFSVGGQKDLARYRWAALKRRSSTPPNNYTNYFGLVDAMTNHTSAIYDVNVEGQIDLDQWARTLAVERIVGNVDSFSWNIGGTWAPHNMYAYKPESGKWKLLMYDLDYSFTENPTNNPLTATFGGDTEVLFLSQRPLFQRAFLRALQDAVNGPLIQSNYTAYLVSNYFALSVSNQFNTEYDPRNTAYGAYGTPIQYLSRRAQTIINSNLNPVATATFAVNAPPGPSQNVVTLTGSAPIGVRTIRINGIEYPVTWTSVTNWSAQVALSNGTNTLQVQGYDTHGNTNTAIVSVGANGPAVDSPESSLVINEILYNPIVPGSEFVEIFNRSTNTTFNLGTYQLKGLDFTFPTAITIAPAGFAVVARNRALFGEIYGFQIPVAGEFLTGTLDPGGEKLTLNRPSGLTNIVVDVALYDDALPWPVSANTAGVSLQLMDPAQDNRRVCNWSTGSTPATRATPGATNSVRTNLATFANLWLNEVNPTNQMGIADNVGEMEPWLELYNADANPISLNGYYLTDTYTNLTKWAFPTNATINAGQFMIVWLDGETAEPAGPNLHTSFRLSGSLSGAIALTTTVGGQVRVFDYLNYGVLAPDQSYGSLRDDKPEDRGLLMRASPRGTNAPVLWINEWMADNNPGGIGGRAEDWFEIYNPNPNSVNLRDYQLSDNTNAWNSITGDVEVSPAGHLLVWADGTIGTSGFLDSGGDLRINFKLTAAGESIYLKNPFPVVIDYITNFAAQANGQSHGRLPDGSANIVAMAPPTPRAANNQAPTITILQPITNQVFHAPVDVPIVVNAADPGGVVARVDFYTNGVLMGSIASAPFACTFFGAAPATYVLTAVAVDSAGISTTSAPVTFMVNSRPTITTITDQTMNEDTTIILPFTIGDLETPLNSLSLSASSFNTGLIPQANLVLGGSGANRTLSITPAPNEFSSGAFGGAYILLIVTDAQGASQGTLFLVTVNSVNDRPTINPIASVTVLQNAGPQSIGLSGIGSGAANESQTLTVTAVSSNPTLVPNPSITYTSPQSTGSLTFTPTPNASGTATITVTVQDNGGTANGGIDTNSVQFTITVPLRFALNLDFAGGTVSSKSGFAATGIATNDFWNSYNAVGNFSDAMSNLKMYDSTVSAIGMQLVNARFPYLSSSSDPMFHTYAFSYDGTITVTMTNLPAGYYDLYLYGHGDAPIQNSTFEVFSDVNYGRRATTKDSDWYFSDWVENRQYVVFRSVRVVAGQPVVINVPLASDGYAAINGMQFVAAAPRLINVDFAGGVVSPKMGLAATGAFPSDFWNSYNAIGAPSDSLSHLKLSDRNDTAVGMTLQYVQYPYPNRANDPMYKTYAFSYDSAIVVTITNLPSGLFDFYLYGHGDADDQNSSFEIVSGSSYGTKSTSTSSDWYADAWQPGRQYVVFSNVQATAGQSVTINVPIGSSGYAIINGMQIVPRTTFIPTILGSGFSLLNLDFNGGAVSPKSGQAAVGVSSNDFWNSYDTEGNASVVLNDLFLTDGTITAVDIGIDNAPYADVNGASDPMFNTLSMGSAWEGTGNITLTVSNLTTGLYDFYLYGHGYDDAMNSLFELKSDANYGMQATTTTSDWSSPVWAEGRQFVVFRNVGVPIGQVVTITVPYTIYGVALANGLQIVSKTARIPSSVVITNNMINVDFAGGSVSAKAGFAAIGATASDFWNSYNAVGNLTDSMSSLHYRSGTGSSVGLTLVNTRFPYSNGGLADPMYDTYAFSYDGTMVVTVTNLPAGNYDLYLYGHGGAANQNSDFEVIVGSSYGTKSTTTGYDWSLADWLENRQYVVFRSVAVTSGQPVTINVPLGPSGYAVINGIQIIFK